MNKEPIYAKLFDMVSDDARFVTKSRRLKHWADVKPDEQPAIFMTQIDEFVRSEFRKPSVYTCSCEVVIYVNTKDTDKTPAEVINPLVGRVLDSIRPSNVDMEQTLGGLCYSCRVIGKIETDEGVLGDQGVAIIPIQMIVNEVYPTGG